MTLEGLLVPGENVLASCKGDKGTLYATDKRILLYKEWLRKESIRDLSYKEVTSINLERQPNSKFKTWGIALASIGFFFAIVFSMLKVGPMNVIGILLLLAGLGLIGGSFALPRSYYRLNGPGILMKEEEANRWKGSFKNRDEASKLVQTIRERL